MFQLSQSCAFFFSECNIVQYLNFSSSITWTMFVSIYDCGTNNFMEKFATDSIKKKEPKFKRIKYFSVADHLLV